MYINSTINMIQAAVFGGLPYGPTYPGDAEIVSIPAGETDTAPIKPLAAAEPDRAGQERERRFLGHRGCYRQRSVDDEESTERLRSARGREGNRTAVEKSYEPRANLNHVGSSICTPTMFPRRTSQFYRGTSRGISCRGNSLTTASREVEHVVCERSTWARRADLIICRGRRSLRARLHFRRREVRIGWFATRVHRTPFSFHGKGGTRDGKCCASSKRRFGADGMWERA